MMNVKKILMAIIMAVSTFPLPSSAETTVEPLAVTDTTIVEKTGFFKRIYKGALALFDEIVAIDSSYVEPQHYKFQAMCQMTNMYERYMLNSGNGEQMSISPETKVTVGPYVGYSLIFLGYTLQLNNLYLGNTKKSFNFSLYTSLIGADFFYRNTNDFKIRQLTLDSSGTYDTSGFKDKEFDGFNVKYWGLNAYYIFNHRKHSYPAAYNQSTRQKRSAGSGLLGFGYGHYTMNMDWEALDEEVHQRIPAYEADTTTTRFNEVRYVNYSLFGGYSYNWVFARNWLLGVSGMVGLSYNHTSGETFRFSSLYDNFKFTKFSIDGVGRMGIVWNNDRIFAGASGQIHSYTYHKDTYSINNLFGTVYVYVGFNFGKKKAYRKPGRFFEF